MFNQLWTAHLQTEEEKQRFINQVKGSKEVLVRLRDMITEKMNELETTERSMKAYDNPNWSHLQAHKNGYMGAMKIIKNILPQDQEN